MHVPFYRHHLDSSYGGPIGEVLDTPFLTSGAVGEAVETDLREFFGAPHAVLTNSWTNGAVATLLALGIGRGDAVIVPAMTFIATANAVELVGARPVFVDVDRDTLLMTPESVRAALSAETRAVIPVHLYGQMCDIAALRAALAGRPDIAIVEDAAHCFEGTLNGEAPGRHSDAAIFSFYATKNVTCGEGGAVITRRADLDETLRQTRMHGMSSPAADRQRGGTYRHWDMVRLGAKANLPDLLAALLPRQIADVRARLAVREALAARYDEAFAESPIRRVRPVAGCVSAHHLYPIHVPPAVRDAALAALNASGVEVTVNYRAVPTLTYYREKYGARPDDFPVSHEWGEGTISLPLFPGLTGAEQGHVIDTVLSRIVPMAGSGDRAPPARPARTRPRGGDARGAK